MSPISTGSPKPDELTPTAGNESEDRYHQLFELVSDALFLIDNETGQILEANEAATLLYGYSHAELLTLRNVDLSAEPEQTRAVTQGQWSRTVVPVRFHRKRDGTVFPVEITGRQFSWQGRPVHLAAIRDISHRLHTEEELRAKTEQLMLVLNGVPALIAYVDAEERYRFVNQPYAEWYGFTPDEMIGQKISELLRPEVYERAAPFYRAALGGQTVAFENLAYNKNGQARIVSVSFTPHVDANGTVQGFLGLIHDITSRRQAEAAAEQTAARLHQLYTAGQALSRTLDPDEIYTLLHQFTRQMMACDQFYILAYEPARQQVTCLAAWEGERRLDANCFPPLTVDHAGQTLPALVIHSGQALLLSDEAAPLQAFWPLVPVDEQQRSALFVPIKEGAVTGLIQLFSRQPEAYTIDQLHLLESFSLHAATALHNARLYRQAQDELAERQRAEDALRASEAHLRSLLESSADGLVVVDSTGTVVEWNPAEVAITGLPRAEAVGRKIWDVEHRLSPPERHTPERLAKLEQLSRELLASAPPTWHNRLWEIAIQRPDGVQRVIQTLVFMIPSGDRFQIGSISRDVTERYQAAQVLQRRAAQLALLSEVSHRIAAELEPDKLLAQAVELIQQTFGYYHVAVYLLDATQRLKLKQVRTGGVTDIFPPDHSLALGQGLVGWVGQQGTPIMANDVTAEPRYVNFYPDRLLTRAELTVPIRLGHATLGVLDVQSPHLNAFDETDSQVLTTLAEQIAVALGNARLYAETRRRLEREERLNELAHALAGEIHLTALFERFLPAVTALTGADCAVVSLVQPDGFVYHDCYQYNLPVPVLPTRRLLTEGVAGQVIQHRTTLLLDDYRTHPAALPAWIETGVRSVLSVPLLIGDEAVGALGLFTLGQKRPFSPEAVISAETAARLVSVALQRTWLFEQEREQRQLAEALAEATAAINSSLELDQVLDQILDQALRVVKAEACNIMLIQGQQARLARWRGYEAFAPTPQIISFEFDLTTTANLRQMIETNAPLLIPDLAAYPNWITLAGTEWVRSFVGAPIKINDLIVGFLNMEGAHPYQFTLADRQRLQAFALKAAAALENAGLYQELRRYAEQLEQRVQERTAQLKLQVARAEAILNSISDGLLVTDQTGTILQTNPVARHWLARFSPAERDQFHHVIRSLAQRAAEQPEALLNLGGLDLQLRAAPISAPISGSREPEPGVVVAAHDISELKAVERLKSSFITNVSHELRTPITTIQLYATLLRRGREEKTPQYLAALEEEAQRLAQMVEKVLQVSRLDANRLELNLRPTYLNPLVGSAVLRHQLLATVNHLTLTFQPATPGPWSMVDPEQISVVCNNLIENALRYTPAGGQVSISTGVETRQGQEWATITVSDTGLGIPAGELPHIFERFYRGDEPRQLQLPGSGLGLSIAHEIITLHSGNITVTSTVGQGSTFTIWLPLLRLSAPPPD